MSLDAYLYGEEMEHECMCFACGNRHSYKEREKFYEASITHNIIIMANKAGLYDCLWEPIEHGIVKASQLIEPLTKGLELLKSDPERFKKHNPKNGWGTYDGLVRFVQNYLFACRSYPDADVEVSR